MECVSRSCGLAYALPLFFFIIAFTTYYIYASISVLTTYCISVASYDFKDSDCLCIAILSHGDELNIYGTDEPVSYTKLLAPFKTTEASSLAGKPKLFIVQVSG